MNVTVNISAMVYNNVTNVLGNMSNMVIRETIKTDLNYSPLIFVNIIFALFIHISVMFDIPKRWKIDPYWYYLCFTTPLAITNVFYFFTHFYPDIGFYF